jgi:hypothetical protein
VQLLLEPEDLLPGQLLLEPSQALPQRGVALLLEGLPLDLELHDAAGDLVELSGHRVDLRPEPRRRLVHEVDGLVGQEPVGDVPVGQDGRRHEGRVLDAHPVMDLVALAAAAEDRDRVLHRGLVDHDGLEPALEGGVLPAVQTGLALAGQAQDGAVAHPEENVHVEALASGNLDPALAAPQEMAARPRRRSRGS